MMKSVKMLLALVGVSIATTLSAKSLITPHVAYYKVTLENSQGNAMVDLKGVMVLKIDRLQDGWVIEQKSSSTAQFQENPNEILSHTLDSQYKIWESEQGNNFNFSSQKRQDQEPAIQIKGEAQVKGNNTLINFNAPDPLSIVATQPVVFPIKHLNNQLQALKDGVKAISSHVFDGSSFSGPVKIKTTVGSTPSQCNFIDQNKQAREINVYPLEMSVYGEDNPALQPNFQIREQMSQDGIMCSYVIDFGSYAIRGDLVNVEYLNPENVLMV